MKYILERVGWSQWYDDGGRWIGNRDAARVFDDRDKAEEVAAALNAEIGADDVKVIEA